MKKKLSASSSYLPSIKECIECEYQQQCNSGNKCIRGEEVKIRKQKEKAPK